MLNSNILSALDKIIFSKKKPLLGLRHDVSSLTSNLAACLWKIERSWQRQEEEKEVIVGWLEDVTERNFPGPDV